MCVTGGGWCVQLVEQHVCNQVSMVCVLVDWCVMLVDGCVCW